MNSPNRPPEGFCILAFAIFILSCHCSLAEGDTKLACNQCYRETICQMSPASFFFEARDLGLINCTQSWLQENFDISEIHDYLSSACRRKRLRKIIAFLFDKPSPEDIPGCSDTSVCHTQYCSDYMKNSSIPTFTTPSDHDTLGPYRMKMISMVSNELIFPDIDKSDLINKIAELVEDDQELDPSGIPPKPDLSCPAQVKYSTKEKVHLLVQTAHSVQHCGSMHLPLDTVNAHEDFHDSFLERVLLLRISALNSIIRHADHQQNFVPEDLKSKCGKYGNRRYLAKNRMILEMARNLFACKGCDQEGSFEPPGNMTSWFNGTMTYEELSNETLSNTTSSTNTTTNTTSGVDSSNSTSTGSGTDPTSETGSGTGEEESECPLQIRYFEAEQHLSMVQGLRNVLKDALDCRFVNCKFVSQDSIGAVYFMLAYHIGCFECNQMELCKDQNIFDCMRKLTPSLKTVFHALKVAGSSSLDCDFELNRFVAGQVERSSYGLIQFHSVLYGISLLSSAANAPIPDCSSTCDRAFGSSKACDICDAIDLAKIVSALTLKVLNCTETFTIGGERFCMPESVMRFAQNCSVNYTSGVQYTAKAKELQALAYAVAALTGCGSSGSTNEFFDHMPKCAYLRSALNSGYTTFPTIIFPEHWLNTKAFKPDASMLTLLQNIYSASCRSSCLSWQELCSASYSCLPRYLDCLPVNPVPPNEAYPLIGHVDMDMLRNSLFPMSSFINETVIIARSLDEAYNGDWVAELSNGHHVNLSAIAGGLLAEKSTNLQFDSADDNSYGARILHYYKLSDIQNFNASHYSNGALVDSSILSNRTRKTAVLLIRPVARAERLRLKSRPPAFKIFEDSKMVSVPSIVEYLNLNIDMQDHNVPKSLYPYVNKDELDIFYQYKATYEKFRPKATVVAVSDNGKWYGKLPDQEFASDTFGLTPGTDFPVFFTKLYFIPSANYYGEAWLHLNVCYCSLTHQEEKPLSFKLRVQVHSVNDQPKAFMKRIQFPPIAFNTTSHPNNGFRISVLQKYASDFETSNLGITVFDALSSKLGKWQYKLQNDTWKDLKQRKMVEHGSSYGEIEIVHLSAEDDIRFKLNNDASHWSLAEAMREVRLHFMFWDMSDNKTTGPEITLLESLDVSAYSREVFGIMLREGCDGKPGSMAKLDACNECGGKRACVGCDGVPFSGARFDSCGQCTGEGTGKIRNFMRDCAGTCGKAELDDCNICQRKSGSFKRSFKDCMGVCFGKAKLNKCNQCFGGTSSLNATAGMDVCGVCNGDGRSCQGCDGVSNSGKEIDTCGSCLHPSDSLFNANCTKISDFNPKSSPITGGREVEVLGAGFSAYRTVHCHLENSDRSVSVKEVTIDKTSKAKFKVTTPRAPAGSYLLKCSFDDAAKIFEAPSLTFKYYNNTGIVINGISSSIVSVNAQNISVTGSGFSMTGQLYCAYMIGRKSALTNAVLLSDLSAVCPLPKFQSSLSLRITVVASLEDGSLHELDHLPQTAWKTLQVYAAAPKAISAKLSDNLKTIIIDFDSKILPRRKLCSDIFESSIVAKFGGRARCYMRSLDKIAIRLGVQATIAPGDAIGIKSDAVYAFNERYSYSASGSVNLQASTSKPLQIKVVGPSNVGICDAFKIKALASGNTGGRRLTFAWSVLFASDVDTNSLTSNDTDDLNSIQSYLNSLPSHTHTIAIRSDMARPTTSQRYIAYEFSVTASNFLGQQNNKSIVVQRMSVKVPVVKILGGEKQRAKAYRHLMIKAQVRQSSCQSSMTLMQYQWEVSPPVDHDIESQNVPRLFIPRGALTGGTTYTFTLTTSFVDDPAVFATASVDVAVESSELIVKIRGGGNRVIGTASDLVLDASRSFDPDRVSNLDEAFTWECYDSSSYPCFVPDKNETSKMVRLVLPQSKKIIVQQGTLPSNATYKFTFTFTKGTRSVSKDVKIRIMPGSPPIVRLRPLKSSKVNADQKVVLKGYVDNPTRNAIDVWWECLNDEDGYSYVNLTEAGVSRSNLRRKIKRRGISWSVLIVNKGVLEEGAAYKIRLNAENNDGSGYAEMVVMANGPPTLGTFTSNVLQGAALETLFTLQAVEGWIDDDEDLPLKYKFGYIKPNGQDGFLGGVSQENEASVFLPAGEAKNNYTLTLFVDVSDNKDSTTRAFHNVVVTPMAAISMETVVGLSGKIEAALEAKDISTVIGHVTSTVSVLNEASQSDISAVMNISSEIKENILKFKENTTTGILSILKSILDAETQNMVVDVISDVTTDGKRFNGQLRKSIAGSIAQVVKGQLLPYITSVPSSSMRVAQLESDDFEGDIGKTPEEIVKIIQTYQNILNTSSHDNTTMQVKREFTDLINSLLTSMCAKSTFGENASVANTDLSILQSFKYDLSDNGTQDLPISCESCEAGGLSPGIINLGKELASKYNEWQCTSDYKCNGLCVGSVHLPKDLFSDEETQGNNTLISGTMKLNLYNPETNSLLTEDKLSAPITVLVPVDKTKYNSSHSTQCKYWDEFTLSWKNDSCTAEKDLKTVGDKSYIVCKCSKTGAIAAFEGPAFAKLATGSDGSGGSGSGGGDGVASSAGNITRNNPLLTLFVVLGILGFSSFLGIGYCGYEKHKGCTQLKPRNE